MRKTLLIALMTGSLALGAVSTYGSETSDSKKEIVSNNQVEVDEKTHAQEKKNKNVHGKNHTICSKHNRAPWCLDQ